MMYRASTAIAAVSAPVRPAMSMSIRPGSTGLVAWSKGQRRQSFCNLPKVPTNTVASPARYPCRSEEHTSELQSLMRNSYDVFCVTKNKKVREHKDVTKHSSAHRLVHAMNTETSPMKH